MPVRVSSTATVQAALPPSPNPEAGWAHAQRTHGVLDAARRPGRVYCFKRWHEFRLPISGRLSGVLSDKMGEHLGRTEASVHSVVVTHNLVAAGAECQALALAARRSSSEPGAHRQRLVAAIRRRRQAMWPRDAFSRTGIITAQLSLQGQPGVRS